MPRFSCSKCKTILEAAPEQAGKVITCPKCQAQMQVPSSTPQPRPAQPAPPPVPAQARQEWYYAKGGQKVGPVSEADLKALIQSGQLSANDMVWKQGTAGWMPVSKLFPSPSAVARPVPPPLSQLANVEPMPLPAASTPKSKGVVAEILADKWVRIGGGILAAVFLITFVPAIFGWTPVGGLVFFNILLALVFCNLIVQRHPVMSLRWLYGIDLMLGGVVMLAALPYFGESAFPTFTVLILAPLNIWIGYQFMQEMTRRTSLPGKYRSLQEGGLSLEFTSDGTLILSNGTAYRYVTRRNDLLLYDGDTLADKWMIVKCDMKTLMLKGHDGKVSEYARQEYEAAKKGVKSFVGWLKKGLDDSVIIHKWTPENGLGPSVEFTHDGAYVSSDGIAGKYTVDWAQKAIQVVLTNGSSMRFSIVSVTAFQLVLSQDGKATVYTRKVFD
jgi:hypothetical protein